LPLAICARAAEGTLTASATISAVNQRVIGELLVKRNIVRTRPLSADDERSAVNESTNGFPNKPGQCNAARDVVTICNRWAKSLIFT
jgi:hypothetical protein